MSGPVTDTSTPPAPLPLERASGGADAPGAAAPGGARSPGHARTPGWGGFWARLTAGRPQARPAVTPWARTGKWILAAALIVLLAWLSFSRGGWIPILSAFDLGVHEFGHLLTMWAPALLCQLAGSFLQVVAPLLLGTYFWWRRDSLAVILMVAWSAENLHNVSVYIADAQVMILPLFGDDGSGAGHDWHNILTTLGALEATDQLALVVRTGSVLLFIVALGLAALGASRARQA